MSDEGLRRLHRRVDRVGRRGMEWLAGGLSAVAACLALVSALSLMQSGEAAASPMPWEAAATRITNDETPASSNKEIVLAQWMVTDLSHGGTDRE